MFRHRGLTAVVIAAVLLFSVAISATNGPIKSASPFSLINNAEPALGMESGGLSLSALNTLLEGGSSALTADTLPNTVGIIEYCITHKLAAVQPAETIRSQLMRRLYQQPARYSRQFNGYVQGQNGMLNTFSGQQLDMSKLGDSNLAQQMKISACDLIIRQGKYYTL